MEDTTVFDAVSTAVTVYLDLIPIIVGIGMLTTLLTLLIATLIAGFIA